ncbi:MAG: beta-ketoacyl-ACP synthase III [Candidatus Omnitrophota bacterium]
MRHVGILGLGSYLPEQKLTNSDLAKIVETSDEWIMSRTGIKERRVVAKGEKTSDLAIGAAKDALKNSHLDASKIDLIVVATVTPDSNFPSVSCLVQKAIGAKHAAGFDISAACAGYLYALTTAKQFIQTGLYNCALVIAAENMTSIIDWTDRGTCVLFGDGAGACVLGVEEKKNHGILADHLENFGNLSDLMSVVVEGRRHPSQKAAEKSKLPYVVMDGKEIFKVAVNSMAEAVEKVAKKAGLKLSDIDCIVPHQANDRIISAVAKKLDVPKEKIFINIDKYGNMSAASIAVAFHEAVQQGRIKKGDYVALVAFGAGLVAAANIVRWA